MADNIKRLQADLVIAGGGPGGCVMAKDLSKKGKKVILIEKGGNDTKYFGNPIGMVLGGHMDRTPAGGFPKTKQGHPLIMGTGVGGGTKLYQGIAGPPDIETFKRYGIDISPYVDKAAKDTWVNDVPDEFFGPETRRLRDAAIDVGLPWEKMQKHIDFTRCVVGCTKCGVGCPEGDKWMGKFAADEAVEHGATLLTHAKVRDIIIENGVAVGVRAKGRNGQRYEVNGNAVVCCSGGIGTTPILKRAGMIKAGTSFTGDPSIMMFGFLKNGRGTGYEHQMMVGNYDDEQGVLLSGGLPAPAFTWFTLHLQSNGLRAVRDIGRYSKVVGAWTKIHDEGEGRVGLDERVSKILTSEDLEKIDYAKVMLEKVLIKAGCNPHEIYATTKIIGHPSGTAPVGKLVDSNLETEIKNLYCCDTSVMPEAPGRPPTWTVVSLAKRLAERLEMVV